ncbi:MAG TPA: hypothetical protein VMW72_26005 [Sedimentisphaerales bacterium]|nr:hypothetical protein [Sedimentisphaerales bacterium]
MNMHESLCSPGFMLTEQVARQIFEVLPEGGATIVIIDREGNNWPSDPEEFAKLNISESFLKELCAKIDDGAEPVVTGADDCSVIAAQLATERSNCGYVVIALPQYSPESILINIDLIEMLLNQIGLIAQLIEKNNLLYEVQMKHYRVCGQSEIALN